MAVRYLGSQLDLRKAKDDALLVPFGKWFYAYPHQPHKLVQYWGQLVTRFTIYPCLDDKNSIEVANEWGDTFFITVSELSAFERE